MNQVLRNILGWVLYFGIIVGLIWGIPKGLSIYFNTPYPMAAITSSSMWPELKQGDLVLIKGVKGKEDISTGDIIVYRNNPGFTIHRVVQIGENTLITKGDANNVSDPPVRYSEIIGKTVSFKGKPFRIPKLGDLSIFVNEEKI